MKRMAAYNEAYDFSMFEAKPQSGPERSPSKKQNDNIVVLPQKELQKNSRPKLHLLKMLSRFLVLALILGALGSLVYGQVRLTELTESIHTAKATLEENESVYTQLQMRVNAQLSMDNAEEYAKKELAMRAAEQEQTEYISISSGDKSEILINTEKENWFTAAWNWLAGLLS